EPELHHDAPDAVTIHSTRVLSYGNTPEGIVKMEANVAQAIATLKAGRLSVIAYACLATSLVKGRGWDERIRASIENETGKPATTAAAATLGALNHVKARRIGIATPYPERIGALVAPFFMAAGFDIAAIRHLDTQDSVELWRTSPAIVKDLALS